MRLRTVFLIYVVATSAAVAAPFVMTAVENARRSRIPVNSEASLEPAPEPYPPGGLWSDRTFACSAPDGTIYYSDGTKTDWRDFSGKNIRPFVEGLEHRFRSCAVGGDGTVYVLGATDAKTYWLNAYQPEGKLKWSVPTQEIRSPLALGRNGVLYLISQSRGGVAGVIAYRSDGSVLWQTAIGGSGWNPTAPAISADGTIYALVTSFTGPPQLVALTPAGREVWRVTVPHPVTPDSNELIVGADGRIFVQVANGVVAFNEQGDKLWEFTAENRDIDGGIALAGDGTLFLASRFLYALDKTGKPKWIFKSELTYMKRDYFGHRPLIAKDGTIYANSYYDQLYAIAPDGRKRWRVSGEPTHIRMAWGQPVLTKEGNLITNAGWFLFTKDRGLATTGWPTENRDNSNSRRQENP